MVPPRGTERDGALNLVLELPDIAGPPMLRKRHRACRDFRRISGFADALRGFAQEETCSSGEFLRGVREAAAREYESRSSDSRGPRENLPSATRCSRSALVAASTRNVLPVWGRVLADRHDFVLFEKAKELRLDVDWQIANLVEEERSACRRSHQAGLVRDGPPVKEPRRCPNNWLSASLASSGRTVVGKKHRGTTRRSDVDGPCDELLASAASPPVTQHGQKSLPCSRCICSTTCVMTALAERNPGSNGLERAIDGAIHRRGTVARLAEGETLARDSGPSSAAA